MRLSDAIRLGAMLRPKAIGFFFHEQKSCAQGAALEACGVPYDDGLEQYRFHDDVRRLWPWATESTESVLRHCPVCGQRNSVAGLIAHLNNTGWGGHDWSREQIADWVATVEPAEMVEAERQPALTITTVDGRGTTEHGAPVMSTRARSSSSSSLFSVTWGPPAPSGSTPQN